MSDTSSTHQRRGLIVDLFIFGFGGTIFLLAGLFSNFYTSQSIEILLVVQGGIMGAYDLSVYRETTTDEERRNLRHQSLRLAFIYSVGVVLMLVNANFSFYSIPLPTAPIGYFTCIGTYLGFIAYYLKLKYALKANMTRVSGILILVGVGTISLILGISGNIRFMLNLTDIWILISAVMIGIAVNLLTRQRAIGKPQSIPLPIQPRQLLPEPKEPQTIPKRETLQRGLNELLILNEAQSDYPSTTSTYSISNMTKLDHQKVLEICRDLGARELLEVKEINGHALVRMTSRGQKALREAG